VVGHEAEAQYSHPVARRVLLEDFEIQLPITITLKDGLLEIAALRNVVSAFWNHDPGETTHQCNSVRSVRVLSEFRDHVACPRN
jgi:hypothetical protein